MQEQIEKYINLENIPSKSIYKRLMRELNLYKDKFISLKLEYREPEYYFYLIDKTNYKYNNYCFILKSDYPFVSPRLMINGISYYDFCRTNSQYNLNLVKLMSGLRCLCCDNILSRDKWNPGYTIDKIVDEINLFRTYKKNVIYSIMIKKIKLKYLLEDIDLDSWLYIIK